MAYTCKGNRSILAVKYIFSVLCIGAGIFFGLPAKAQFPTIGQPMPAFTLNNLIDHPKKSISSNDLKGKWYILDFWLMGCKPCIESFPAVSAMAEKFKGKVEIISVGIGGKELEQFYEPIRKRKALKIPMAFDQVLADKWQVNSYPLIFIVDDKGILRVITYETNAEKLASLMDTGKDHYVKNENYREFLPNDISRLYFIDGNGGNDSTFLFRSVLARGSANYSPSGIANLNQEGPGYGDLVFISATNLKKGLFQMSNTSLLTLYNTAYFGQDRASSADSIYKETVLLPSYQDKILWPILEVKDSSNFRVNYKTSEGIFTYSLSVPVEKASREFVMKAMQMDLLKCFGYDAKIETRKWPVWKLVVTDHKKVEALRTKGADPQTGVYTNAVSHIINARTTDIMAMIASSHPWDVFFDETGVGHHIDMSIEAPLRDLSAVKKELNKNGFDMVQEQKEMKILVIRDPV